VKHLHSRRLAQPLALVLLIFAFGLNAQGQYTISNQEPITVVPNSSAMFAKPLPSNILSHLAVTGGSYLANSDTMIAYELSLAVSGDRGMDSWAQQAYPNGDQHPAKYYGQSTDPIYTITSCAICNPGTLNTPFHAPSGAKESGGDTGGGGSDKWVVIWDQTNNNIFDFYQMSLAACPGGGHAGTSGDPCQVSCTHSCGKSNFTSSTALVNIDTGWALPGILPFQGMVRMQELVSGHINHAIYLDAVCNNGNTVYPNITGYLGQVCSSVGKNNTTALPAGALVFFDYTTAQLADIKTKVDAWQYPLIEAMTIYGGYEGDTGGAAGIGMGRGESEVAYNLGGVVTPHPSGYTNFFTWLQSQTHSGCISSSGALDCQLRFFENLPAEPNNIGGSDTSITGHLHVADQCIAKALAGVSGGCPASTPSVPSGLTALAH
jgi:hypothetical protein